MGHRNTGKFARQVESVREQVADNPLAFQRSLSTDIVHDALKENGIEFRERVFTPWVTIAAFLSQLMGSDHSCRFAVLSVMAGLIMQGKRMCSPSTSSYCEARSRLPEAFYKSLFRRVGRQTMDDAPQKWLFHGRQVKVVDGTTASMPDTKTNQEAYPQPNPERIGLGFPTVRLLVLFSLSVGTVLEAVIRPYQGKRTGELAMFRELCEQLNPGEIVLGDKGFCSFCHVAWLHQHSIDMVVTLNKSRLPNLKSVEKLGRNDWLYEWRKPNEKSTNFTAQEFQDFPEGIPVRMVSVNIRTPGFRPKKIEIITTLVDHRQFPASEIAELYRRRWMCELYLRDIKTTLQMDQLRCESPEMVRKEIFAHLLGYNIIRTQMAQAAFYLDMSVDQISFKGTAQALAAFQPYRSRMTPEQLAVMIAAIAYHQVGKQPGRCEPRKVKRRPKSFGYLTETREAARKRLCA
jgi:hypothetical protein